MDTRTTNTPCPCLPKPRSFWQRIGDRLAAMRGSRRAAIPPERSVAFTIAVIALGAKLAKSDGTVGRAEVAAFRRVFIIPRSEEKNAARVFDLARQDVAGFDAWARRIAAMFPPGDPVLADVIEGLCIIAVADGGMHENEILFIDEVGRIFGLPAERVAAIRLRHDRQSDCPPCDVLGIPLARGAQAVPVADPGIPSRPGHRARLAARGRAPGRSPHPPPERGLGKVPPDAPRLGSPSRRVTRGPCRARSQRLGSP